MFRRSVDDLRMILNAGAAVFSGGTSSEILSAGLGGVKLNQKSVFMRLDDTHIRLATVEEI